MAAAGCYSEHRPSSILIRLSIAIELPDGHWELAAIPIDGWSGAIRRDLAIFDSGALASALLLSAIAYLLSFRDARLALRVAEGTRALTS